MRRIASAALTFVMAFSLMLTFTSTVQANALAGGGKSSSDSGESVFTNLPAGASGQFSVIFFNDGTTTWSPGVVGLLVCAADKTTCNVASPNAAYASGWFSSTVYATVSTTVGPGQNGFFIWNFTVPAGTAAGTVATFNGDVGDIATGLEYRPEGYFQQNQTPSAGGGLTISPASASIPVGGTQQFTASGAGAGATITWSVNGGCGAITNAGLFAATATNSATQPCNVVASSSDGLTAVAPITVFGPANSASCSANPTSVIANGSNTVTFTFTLKDANGNTVVGDSSTTITITRDPSASNVCFVNAVVTGTNGSVSSGSGSAKDVAGIVQFQIKALSTPGSCPFTITTDNSSIAGTTAT